MAADLVVRLARQLRESNAQEEGLKDLMTGVYEKLPKCNHLSTIPGIGVATAAVLTAKIVDIERFAGPNQLVSYFGIFPQEESSGIDKNGQAKRGRQKHMSRKGNDLARKYLWNAAKAAMRWNPAVRPLYERLVARGSRGDVALGHCMRKLLHLVFAIWQTGKPFDPKHYPWEPKEEAKTVEEGQTAAGHKPDEGRQESVVTTAGASIPGVEEKNQAAATKQERPTGDGGGGIDYAALRRVAKMGQVLAALGWLDKMKGDGPQRRGQCPIHAREQDKDRSFSVNLEKDVFRCFNKKCGAQGNVLDLWVAMHGKPLYEAAKDMAGRLGIDLFAPGTGKRNP